MKTSIKTIGIMVPGLLLPVLSQAQGVADDMHNLHSVLNQLYEEMIPLSSKLISVGQGIAGFAATWYIAARIWRHIANAEPIDFYPLFRPFVLGFCIMIFPSVLAMINGIMKPTVSATAGMVEGSNKAIENLLKQKEQAVKESKMWQMYVGADNNGDRDKWLKYTQGLDDQAATPDEGVFEGIGNSVRFAMERASYNFKNSIKEWMSEVLHVIFEAAALCIDTLRTFQLIVLAILGPLVFGIAVFDGFQHTLTSWIARYLNVFLWLPVANIFGAIIGKVQEKMIVLDIGQIEQTGDTFFSASDTAYLVFMIIGIVGYFTVPSVANFIVNAGFSGALQQKITSMVSATGASAQAGGMAAGTHAATTAGNIVRIPQYMKEGYDSKGEPSSSHLSGKISGNP